MKKKLPPPPAGYRWLKSGETIGENDRYYESRPDGVALRRSLEVGSEVKPNWVGQYVRRLPGRPKSSAPAPAPAPAKAARDVPPMDPPAGYRWLKRGEVVEKTDVVVAFPGRPDTAALPVAGLAGSVVGSRPCDLGDTGHGIFLPYARKIETPTKSALFLGAPAGYRELNEGETILPTDAYLLAGQWFARRGTKNCGSYYRRGVNRPTVRFIATGRHTCTPFPAPLGHKFWEPGTPTPTPEGAWYFHPVSGFYAMMCGATYSGKFQGKDWACGQVVVPVSQPKPADAVPVPGVNPGKGWRFLKQGETLQEGDEVVFVGGYARDVTNSFGTAVNGPGAASFPEGYYRRRIGVEVPAPSQPADRTVIRRHEFGEVEVTRLAKTYNHPDSGFPIAYHATFARRDGVTSRHAFTEVGLAAIVDAFNELRS